MRDRPETLRMLFVLTLAFAAAAAGCTFKSVTPEVLAAPAQKYSVVVVGPISTEDRLWEPLVPHFRQGLIQHLREKKAFDEVVEGAPATAGDSPLVLTGKITEVNKGSTALRWIVGFGAGRARVNGVLEIRDAGDRVLAKLTAQESYLGGAGLGGAGFLDMEDLMRRFGETMAEKVIQWSRGEKID